MTYWLYSKINKNLTHWLWNCKKNGDFFTGMKKTVLVNFGKRVRELRLERGWTQEYLAEKTGFHPTYIGRVERGERNLSLVNVEKFANTFAISLKSLFELCN